MEKCQIINIIHKIIKNKRAWQKRKNMRKEDKKGKRRRTGQQRRQTNQNIMPNKHHKMSTQVLFLALRGAHASSQKNEGCYPYFSTHSELVRSEFIYIRS